MSSNHSFITDVSFKQFIDFKRVSAERFITKMFFFFLLLHGCSSALKASGNTESRTLDLYLQGGVKNGQYLACALAQVHYGSSWIWRCCPPLLRRGGARFLIILHQLINFPPDYQTNMIKKKNTTSSNKCRKLKEARFSSLGCVHTDSLDLTSRHCRFCGHRIIEPWMESASESGFYSYRWNITEYGGYLI